MTQIVKEKVAIPEQLTIGGVTYVVKDTPEIQEFITAVSRVEKTKLYSQIESVKNEVEKLNNVQVIPQGQQSEIAPFSEDTVVTKVVEQLTPSLRKIVGEVVDPLLKTQAANQQQELSDYRERLITENEATCIPDLVKGNTKEEIEKSLQESIRLRAAYPPASPAGNAPVVDPLLKKQFEEAAATQQPAVAPEVAVATPAVTPAVTERPVVPGIPAVPAEQAVSPDIKSMSPEEFARHRESLKAQIENLG